jgi:hypothetical protein
MSVERAEGREWVGGVAEGDIIYLKRAFMGRILDEGRGTVFDIACWTPGRNIDIL